MTLVLTEVTEFGIAMAADSALTFPDRRTLFGIQKLLPIRELNAGVAMWGAGMVGDSHTDVWLEDVIQRKITSDHTLWDAANLIAEALNSAYKRPLSDYSGMHVAGYDVDEKGERLPAVYHIHNGHHLYGIQNRKFVRLPQESPREFRVHKDFPPHAVASGADAFMLRNGDIMLFSVLSQGFAQLFDQLRTDTDLLFPYPNNLEGRGEYLRFWINLMSQIYRRSNYFPSRVDMPTTIGGASIGGPISVLTIDSTGICSFYAV